MNIRKYVTDFIRDYLDNDINKFKYFNFEKLKNNNKYGYAGRNFDCDNTNLARAIFELVWGDEFPSLLYENIGTGKIYRGDTINSFATLLSRNLCDELQSEDDRNYTKLLIGNQEENKSKLIITDSSIINKIIDFRRAYHTLGNMTILPNKYGDIAILRKKYDKHKNTYIIPEKGSPETFNKYRGSYSYPEYNYKFGKAPIYSDYFDIFLKQLRNCFLDTNTDNYLYNIFERNEFYFEKFTKDEKGFLDYCQKNYFTPFLSSNTSKIKILFQHYRWSDIGTKISPKEYTKEIIDYIKKSKDIIEYRADKIIDILKFELY